MNAARKLMIFAASSLLLAGCASTGTSSVATSQSIVVDGDYVAAVEKKAKPAGVRVVWVNPPKRRNE